DLTPLSHSSSLVHLDCSETRVADLSPIVGIPTLRELWAEDCVLDDFPRSLLESLDLLLLTRTAIPGIPGEVLLLGDNCLRSFRDHLADLDLGAEALAQTKVIVLGNGGVGKTQICRRLRGLTYDEKVPSSHGITIAPALFSGSAGEATLN